MDHLRLHEKNSNTDADGEKTSETSPDSIQFWIPWHRLLDTIPLFKQLRVLCIIIPRLLILPPLAARIKEFLTVDLVFTGWYEHSPLWCKSITASEGSYLEFGQDPLFHKLGDVSQPSMIY